MATQQPIFGVTSDGVSSSGIVEYIPINARGIVWTAAYNNIRQIIPTGGTFKQINIKIDTPPGAAASGNSWTFGLTVNGTISTTLQGTISETATTLTITADQAVSQGDFVALECSGTSTPDAFGRVDWSVVWEPTIDEEYLVLGGGSSDTITNSGTEHNHIEGAETWFSASHVRDQIIAAAGTASKLTAATDSLLTAAGTADFNLSIRAIDDGATRISSGTASLTDAVQSDTDTVNTDALAAGEMVEMRCVTVGSGNHVPYWSFVFTPTTAGQIPQAGGLVGDASETATEFNFFGMGQPWSATRTARNLEIVGPNSAIVVISQYMELRNVAGTGDSYTLRLEKNAVDEASSDTVVTGATQRSANATGLSISYADGDLINVESVPVGPPSPRTIYYGHAFTFAGIPDPGGGVGGQFQFVFGNEFIFYP